MKLFNVGFHNFIPMHRIIMILDFDSPAAFKVRDRLKEKWGDDADVYVLNLTRGRPAQSLLVLDTGHVIYTIKPRRMVANIIENAGLSESPDTSADD